jgi:translocation and assembly module TamB
LVIQPETEVTSFHSLGPAPEGQRQTSKDYAKRRIMAHRSNQAVASQDQAPITPDEPPTARRFLIGWVTAVAALGVSTFLVGLGLWFARLPLADFMIGAALAERGVEADFQVVSLDLEGVTLTNMRFGAATTPDAAISTVEASWRWDGMIPKLDAVRLTEPVLRLRLTPRGQVSAGALDNLGGGPRGRQRPSIPTIDLEIVDGRIIIDAPFGELQGPVHASGRIGEDFNAVARIAETSRAAPNYTLDRGQAELVIAAHDNNTVALRLSGAIAGLHWADARAENGRLLVLARTPLSLERLDLQVAWSIGTLASARLDATGLEGAAGAEALMRDNALELAAWEGQAHANAATLAFDDIRMQRPRFAANADGAGAVGRARWTLGGDHFDGLGLVSQQPAASGHLTLAENGALSGDALISMARAALSGGAQDDVRRAFPQLNGSPVGPTFAQARAALERAADSFTLSAPLLFSVNDGELRITLDAPAEARAASGAVLRFAPLRQDAPALVIQWPGPGAQGSASLELSGGGAPSVSLLLDTITSSQEAPFEADGTLTLANWRADTASIAAPELDITISASGAGGRIDLRGPALISGPVGDGEVRDLAPTLDLAISWGNGWRVTPNTGCLPVRMSGLDVAGLSFVNGAFALCPLDGALMAADPNNNLSGGFSIQRLALNGHMAGPNAQPARIGAENVVGRFGGRTGDIALALVADRPSIDIEMAAERTLNVALRRITANARIADSWRVEGGFEQGALSDPTLPGSVSTIEGAWTAAPEDGKPMIRIAAAEAVLTANRPASDNERPLFNPLRLVNVDAVLRDGIVDATGAILLEAQRRQLADFTARHVMSDGAGAARVNAANLTFNPTCSLMTSPSAHVASSKASLEAPTSSVTSSGRAMRSRAQAASN